MKISIEKLLYKMDEELKEAKESSTEAAIRERIHAIKTMCELILDEPLSTRTVVNKPVNVESLTSQGSKAKRPNDQERLIIDDESNGESIFDF